MISEYHIEIYLTFFIVCVAFSCLINSLFLRFAKSIGIKNVEDGTIIIRWGTQTKPTLGGLSFYIIFLFSVASYSILFSNNESFLNSKFIGLLLASTLGFLIGLSDDAYGTKPILKFLGQVLCGIILIASDIYIFITPYTWLNYLFTMFWVIGIMNSINMLDNIDGITTTTSMIIIAASLGLILMYHDFNNIHVIILLGVLAALAGFLFFNWYPSKMYMGDTGTQFLGVFLAAIGILFFWNVKDVSGEIVQSKQLIIPCMVFIVPIIDTTTVVINRLRKGQSPFIGGKDHTTHHLVFWGFTERQAVIFLNLLSLLSIGMMVLIVKYINEWSHLMNTLAILYFMMTMGFLYLVTRFDKSEKFKFRFKKKQEETYKSSKNVGA